MNINIFISHVLLLLMMVNVIVSSSDYHHGSLSFAAATTSPTAGPIDTSSPTPQPTIDPYYDCSSFPNFASDIDKYIIMCSGKDIENKGSAQPLDTFLHLSVFILQDATQYTGTLTSNFLASMSDTLTAFRMRNLTLSGVIPNNPDSAKYRYDNLGGLNSFDLSYNKFKGAIPTWFGDLQRLEELNLNNNELSGTIPSGFASTMYSLKTIDLSHNKLNGTVDPSLFQPVRIDEKGNFTYLNEVRLSNNSFTRLPPAFLNYTGSVYLGFNPWICDCDTLDSIDRALIKDWTDAKCSASSGSYAGQPIGSLRRDPEAPCRFAYDVTVNNITQESFTVNWKFPRDRKPYAVHFEVQVYEEPAHVALLTSEAGWQYADSVATTHFSHFVISPDVEGKMFPYRNYSVEIIGSHIYYDGLLIAIGTVGSNPENPDTIIDSPAFIDGEYVDITADNFDDLLIKYPDPNGPMANYLGLNQQISATEIRARERRVRGPGSTSVKFVTVASIPGSPPQKVSESEKSFDGFVITWDPPAIANGPVTDLSYDVSDGEIVRRTNGTSYTFVGMVPEKVYNITVRARAPPYALGTGSDPSDPFAGPWTTGINASTLNKCAPGTYIEGLECKPCDYGTYINETGAKACYPCPLLRPATLVIGANDERYCVVGDGYTYDAARSIIGCPKNGICTSSGLLIENIGVKPGYWRTQLWSTEIFECLGKGTFCKGASMVTNVTTDAEELLSLSLPANISIWESSLYCISNHVGPLCESCIAGFRRTDGGCIRCNETGYANGSDEYAAVGCIFAAGIIFAIGYYAVNLDFSRRHDRDVLAANEAAGIDSSTKVLYDEFNKKELELLREKRLNTRSGRFLERIEEFLTPNTLIKIKITFGAIQVVGAFQVIFANVYPKLYLAFFSWLNVLAINIPFYLPLGCVIKWKQYEAWLLLITIVPLIMCALVVVLHKVISKISPEQRNRSYKVALHATLLITFVFYPGASSTIFKAFTCRDFDDGSSALVADSKVDCLTPEYRAWRSYAGFMILIWPIGGIALYSYFLHKNKPIFRKYYAQQKIRQEYGILYKENVVPDQYWLTMEEYVALDNLHFIWSTYEPKYYYFELVMLLTKLIETSIAPLFYPGTSLQVLMVGLTSFIFLAIFTSVRPLRGTDNNHLLNFLQACLFFLSFGALLTGSDVVLGADEVKSDSPWDTAQGSLSVFLIILTLCIIFAMFVQLGFARFFRRKRQKKEAKKAKARVISAYDLPPTLKYAQ